jgi:hypothetical protein
MHIVRSITVTALFALFMAFSGSSAKALDICEEGCQPPPAEQGTPYEFAFEAEEGCVPYRFSHLNGTVPPGLVITQDGKLTGTPTEAGTFDFWVGLDDNGGPSNPACLVPAPQSQGHYFLTVLPDLAVTTESLPAAVTGEPYSVQLQFSNPEFGWPVIWDITQGALPTGLALSESGLLSGTPTGADSTTFVVRAREPFRRFGERQLTLVSAAKLAAAAPSGRVAEVGVRYAASLGTSGGTSPFTWAVESGSLPSGLALNPASGAIRGVPAAAGRFAVTFAVTDAGGQKASVSLNVQVAAKLAISTAKLPSATSGAPYRARLTASGGLAPKAWSFVGGTLPRGIKLSRATGVLSGVARKAGTYRITVRATDRLGASSKMTLVLIVR